MRPEELRIDEDVRFAQTPPAELYRDPAWYAAQLERVFRRAWLLGPELRAVAESETAWPFTLLPGTLDEPLLLTRDRKRRLHCVSNACTHRGNVVQPGAGAVKLLRCGYHGRTFRLDGDFQAAPGFEGVPGFPSPSDSLRRFPVGTAGPLVFTGIEPAQPLEELLAPFHARLGRLGEEDLVRDADGCRDYDVAANWALYVENYLEGLHVPFVHAGLAQELAPEAGAVELLPHGVLQVGVAREGGLAFEHPEGHPDHGLRVAAYWFWLWPATMLNVYPWGLSVNAVEPIGPERCRVRYLTYVGRPELRGRGAGADLPRVELEDEAVVESCQRGLRSRTWPRGRYAPRHERGVHHFHRLLAAALARA